MKMFAEFHALEQGIKFRYISNKELKNFLTSKPPILKIKGYMQFMEFWITQNLWSQTTPHNNFLTISDSIKSDMLLP